jgi:hypothetical protein
MIDIKKVREALYKIGTIPLQKNDTEWTTLSSRDEYKIFDNAITELERLQKKEVAMGEGLEK